MSPGRRQAIIWNNAGLLLIEPLGTNLSEISFKKMHLNMSSGKCRPFCLGLNVLNQTDKQTPYQTHKHAFLAQLQLSFDLMQVSEAVWNNET